MDALVAVEALGISGNSHGCTVLSLVYILPWRLAMESGWRCAGAQLEELALSTCMVMGVSCGGLGWHLAILQH